MLRILQKNHASPISLWFKLRSVYEPYSYDNIWSVITVICDCDNYYDMCTSHNIYLVSLPFVIVILFIIIKKLVVVTASSTIYGELVPIDFNMESWLKKLHPTNKIAWRNIATWCLASQLLIWSSITHALLTAIVRIIKWFFDALLIWLITIRNSLCDLQ